MTYKIGGKALGLESLVQNKDLGFHIPFFNNLDTSFYDIMLKQAKGAEILSVLASKPYECTRLPKGFDTTISNLAKKFKDKQVMVRSSSLHEDGDHSFAGIYDSFLIEDVTEENLAKAIFDVYASLNSERAVSYRAEHGIEEDEMAVIVQTFIEPDWSGVMYTSNPSYSPDLAIEFVRGRNTIVNGEENPFVLDFDKESRELVFKSENLNGLCMGNHNYDIKGINIDKLVEMGIELEKRTFPSDIEFVVKNNRIYFVQQRRITDLEEPVEVNIPEYKPEQFIGSTHMKRGSGKVTLPVVSIGGLVDLVEKIDILTQIAPDEYEAQVRSYFKNILKNDKKYESGYLLLIPHVAETVMPAWSLIVPEISIDATMDSITPNKKAVISTRFGSICSHMMTVSRERGIPYASFSMSDELFNKVHTGEVLSIYFTGREAYVFKEENKSRGIREEHPEISFLVDEFEDGTFAAQTSSYLDSWIPYIKDFDYFLNESTEKNWKFTEWEEQMGGYFTNEDGKQIVMNIARSDGAWHRFSFPGIEWHKNCGYEPLPENEYQDIMQQYKKYLTE